MAKRLSDEILAVVAFFAGIFVAVSLATHHPWDPSPFTRTGLTHTANRTGPAGAWLSETLFQMLGSAALAVPVFLVIYAARRLAGREKSNRLMRIVSVSAFVLSFTLMLHYLGEIVPIQPEGLDAGGMTGYMLARSMSRLFSDIGTLIIGLAAFVVSVLVLVPITLVDLLKAIWAGTKALFRPLRPLSDAMEKIAAKRAEEAGSNAAETLEPQAKPLEAAPVIVADSVAATETRLPQPEEPPIEFLEPPPELRGRNAEPPPNLFSQIKDGGYVLPSVGLLSAPPKGRIVLSADDLCENLSILERKLADYGVSGKVSRVQPGPVVSMYEFEPAAGVKINKVMSLADDLAMSMKVERIRVTTLYGKAAIGIEIPNEKRETVYLREILSARDFVERKSPLSLALGKDILGKPMVADLARMPHLLVAGATGAGKSVAVNGMILSMLYKASPADLRLVMIDPKMLELSVYQDIPHLFAPVITAPKDASGALRKLVFEMETRYRLLAAKGVRNIDGYNAALKEGEEKLPYIVVLIDELADLMLTAPREIEDSIARLAQMARAAGIHLILATQRPSVDVLTGVIKANFPARISFQVSSKVDSRTILDSNGAEQLLGKGDMLLLSPGYRLVRIHGAYVDETEIGRVVDFVKAQGQPDYAAFEKIVAEDEAYQAKGGDTDRDELYRNAVDAVVSSGQASISYIQRRLKIGYNRAARIMELMEEDGIVGPPREAGKPREILIAKGAE
ncbi:MAG: DNA translocase FtsK 4TM domain-containing protein [Nitrospirae bacterium]|nr:DNA translocase FtsK 4TM domain-containing protein [Nitrospirota bacterium]